MLTRRQFVQTGMALGALSVSSQSRFAETVPRLSIIPIAPGVWLHTSWKRLANGEPFPSNGLIVSGHKQGLIVDTTWPTEDMHSLLKMARELTGNRPLQLVVTHAHDDRMSGLEIARALNVKSLAHTLTQADAESRGLPPADEIWAGKRKNLSLGGRTARLFRPGPAHTRDNIVVFVQPDCVLFGGCMIRSGATRWLGNTADADIGAWASSVDAIISEFGDRIQIVVPGHGDPGGPELLEHTRKLADVAAKEAR